MFWLWEGVAWVHQLGGMLGSSVLSGMDFLGHETQTRPLQASLPPTVEYEWWVWGFPKPGSHLLGCLAVWPSG